MQFAGSIAMLALGALCSCLREYSFGSVSAAIAQSLRVRAFDLAIRQDDTWFDERVRSAHR
jgi:hypothetical protein